MSLDRRLREGLHDVGIGLEPDVEDSLQIVLRKGRRTRVIRRSAGVAAAAAAVVPLVFAVPAVLHLSRGSAHPAQPAASALQKIGGSYAATIPVRTGVVMQRHLAGHWALRLSTKGVLSVSPPRGFAFVRSGSSFTVTATKFRTDLFTTDLCTGLAAGNYSWRLSGHTLVFTTTSDPCSARAALLTSSPWTLTSR